MYTIVKVFRNVLQQAQYALQAVNKISARTPDLASRARKRQVGHLCQQRGKWRSVRAATWHAQKNDAGNGVLNRAEVDYVEMRDNKSLKMQNSQKRGPISSRRLGSNAEV